MNTVNTNRINLVDDAALKDASDIIRDGEFADSDLHFDCSQQSVTLRLWKADEDLSIEGAGLRTNIAMRLLALTFRSVVGVKFIRQSAGMGNHPVGGIRCENRRTACIDTYDGVTVELSVSGLDGTLEITDRVDRNRTR